MRELYLDFIDEPLNTSRRLQTNTGIYQDYLLDKNGIKLHLILLDTRTDYHKPTGDYLGPAQLAWLAHQLATTEADVTLIGSGVQVLPMRNSPMEEYGWESKRGVF